MASAPAFNPEKNRIYAKNSPERSQLEAAIAEFKKDIPFRVVTSFDDDTGAKIQHVNPAEHASALVSFSPTSDKLIPQAVSNALEAKEAWTNLPFRHRAAIFLRSADLIAAKHRNMLTSALMVCQGMDARQAEVVISDLIDILRFNVQCAEKLYAQQPQIHAPGIWNTIEYPPIEGFVLAKTSSDSLAVAGNLVCAPTLMGNAILWTPPKAVALQSHILLEILIEAGLPLNVVQLLLGPSPSVMKALVENPKLGALAFSGPLSQLLQLQAVAINRMMSGIYHTFPRIIAETNGNNYHLIHPKCDLDKAVSNTIRAAFEYQGQKTNSLSTVYVPSSIWTSFKAKMKKATNQLSVGPTHVWKNFVGPVIDEWNFNALKETVNEIKISNEDLSLISGGLYDDSTGYFFHPTIYATVNLFHPRLSPKEPVRGPILFIGIYDDGFISTEKAWESICKHIKFTAPNSWKSGSIFSSDRQAISLATSMLRDMTGNLYINTRCNAPQVGQSPYGGGRLGGTGEKTGSVGFLERFVNVCSVKEELLGGYHVIYASHVE